MRAVGFLDLYFSNQLKTSDGVSEDNMDAVMEESGKGYETRRITKAEAPYIVDAFSQALGSCNGNKFFTAAAFHSS